MRVSRLWCGVSGVVFMACAPCIPASAQVPAAQVSREIGAEAQATLETAYDADQPGAAGIITRHGNVLYVGGRGLADIDTKRPIAPNTVFRTASITKQFVAATVLKLVEDGSVSLDDPLRKFFPDWPEPSARATIRQLLNHSSGIFDFSKIPGYMMSPESLRPNTTEDLLALTRSQPAKAEPGTSWEYSNGGYVILGAILEKITGKAWHEVVIERVARPLGLDTVAYLPNGEVQPNSARFYGGQNGEPAPARGVHYSVAHAAGGLMASVEDMAKWADALHHGRVVSPALYREMTSPARLANGETRPYGFGLRLLQLRGRPAFVHGGAGRGVDTASIYVPSEDVFAAVFSNSDVLDTDAQFVAQRLAALALGQPIVRLSPVQVPREQVVPFFGVYEAAGGQKVSFFERDGKYYFGDEDEERELLPAGSDRFMFADGALMAISFERAASGSLAMILDPPNASQPLRAVRTGDVPAAFTIADAVLQSYIGTYRTEQPVLVVGRGPKGWLTIGPVGAEAIPLRPISETEFRADANGTRVVFHRERGRTDRITLYRGARELHGNRVEEIPQ